MSYSCGMQRVCLLLKHDTMVATSMRERLVEKLAPLGFHFTTIANVREVSSDSDLVISDDPTEDEIGQIRAFPSTRLAIADPKVRTASQRKRASLCDFAIVGSIEHKRILDRLGLQAVVFPFLPDLGWLMAEKRETRDPHLLTLFYHGNRVHLETFSARALKVLDDAALGFRVRLEAHYNMSTLGAWRPGKLQNIEVLHRNWHVRETYQRLAQSDIGIVPNAIPTSSPMKVRILGQLPDKLQRLNTFGYRSDDYIVRFKPTSNPGRIYPFAVAGIPVIADFFPSSANLVRDEVDGFLCYSDDDWGSALDALLREPDRARAMGNSLKRRVKSQLDGVQADKLLACRLTEFIKGA